MKRISVFLTTLLISAIGLQCFSGLKVQAAGGIAINSTNFPDANFRAVLSDPIYDQDGNGYFSDYEISRVINIYCEGENISSLKGIEYFTALQGLWCKDNKISSMDLSNNKDLRGVWCSGNLFTSLDFSANPELEWVYCYDCRLTSLNVSKNSKMAYIECNTNPNLKKLDVSSNTALEHLMCASCGIEKLDLSNNKNLSHLDAFNNKLTSISFKNNTKLKRLDIWENENLGNVDISMLHELQYYSCAANGVTSLDVSHNPELQKLVCSYNDISTLNLKNNPKLAYLDCACNNLSSLDLSKNPQLYFCQAFTNNFKKLNISNNSRLKKVYKDGYYKDEYAVCVGHSWSINYGNYRELGNEILYFLCVDDKVTVTASTGAADTYDSYINTNDGLTSSSDIITREMAVETLYALAGSPSVKGLKVDFKDVKAGSRYENAVKWAVANKICFGYPNICSDTFGVGAPVTREDLAFMLHRYAALKKYKTALDYGRTDNFRDYFDIDYYAWAPFTWAIQFEILLPKGPKSDPYLYPHGRVSRSDFKSAITTLLKLNYEKVPSKIPIPSTPAVTSGWVKDSTGWWYREYDGTYPKACWKEIDAKWYYFNSDGYVVTGWLLLNSSWYYFGPDGDLKTGWQLINGRWFFFNEYGDMATGWKQINGKWYYFNPDGDMVTGWKNIGGKWYYFNTDGSISTGWKPVNGKWYYFTSDGEMVISWKKIDDSWYYFDLEGVMQTGWKKIAGRWYYFYSSGEMAHDTTIDGYNLNSNGEIY